SPFEQGGLVPVRWHRVAEVDVPVHAAAERLVLRVTAPAERAMLRRSALRAWCREAIGLGDRDTAGDPVRPVLGDRDRARPGVVPVGVPPRLAAVDGVPERS